MTNGTRKDQGPIRSLEEFKERIRDIIIAIANEEPPNARSMELRLMEINSVFTEGRDVRIMKILPLQRREVEEFSKEFALRASEVPRPASAIAQHIVEVLEKKHLMPKGFLGDVISKGSETG